MHLCCRAILAVSLLLVSVLVSVNAFGPARSEPAAAGPSFNCKYAKRPAEKLICADPALAALDRQLAETLLTLSGQPLDQKALRTEEDNWLLTVRNACETKACIADAYKKRMAELLAKSAHAASPAASAETQPFDADPKLLAEAQKHVGNACSFEMIAQAFDGFTVEPNWAPAVILNGFDIVIRRKEKARFAFLFALTQGDKPSCKIVDVAVLPPQGRVMSCSAMSPELTGIGIRPNTSASWAFWSVDAPTRKLMRQPLGVLGIADKGANKLDCRQPEWGE